MCQIQSPNKGNNWSSASGAGIVQCIENVYSSTENYVQ